MNRKTLGLLALSAVLAASLLVGCAPKEDGNDASGGSSAPSSAPVSSEESSAPASNESSAPADSQGGMPSTAGGVVFGEPDAKLSAAYDAAKKAMGYGFVPNPMDDSAQLKDVYGVSPDLVKSAIVEIPAVSAQAGYFVGIHAAEGKGDDVNKALKTFRDKIAEDSFQYPMNLGKIAAGMVYQDGDYVFYVALGDTQKAMDMDDAEQAAFYQSENEKAVDAIKEALK